MASSIPPPHPDLKSPGNMNSLDELIAESERSLKRLEQLQKKKDLSIGQRFSSHLKRNSGHLINVALAGSVFVVALSRLNEKYSHQADKAELEEKLNELMQQNERITGRLAAAETFAREVEQAAEVGGRQLSARLRDALGTFRSSFEQGSVAASAVPKEAPPPPPSTPSRPMI